MFCINHRARLKSTINNFASWLIEKKGLLQQKTTRGVNFPRSRCSLLVSFQRISAIFYAPLSSMKEIVIKLLRDMSRTSESKVNSPNLHKKGFCQFVAFANLAIRVVWCKIR